MKAVRRLCAVLVGLVFFVAGILKLMDPVGSGLVVEAQLRFLHMGFLCPISGFLGEIFALADAVLGAALLAGVWKRNVTLITSALLVFYTLLTLLLLVFNPDISCGCFGEAFHLTHLQSFLKNVILLGLMAVSAIPIKYINNRDCGRGKIVGFLIVSVCVVFFSVYSELSLPLVDYTPLAPGSEFAVESEYAPEPGSAVASEPALGSGSAVTSEPALESGSADDGWAELSFCDAEGGYADSLLCEDRVVVVSVYNPSRISDRGWRRIAGMVDIAASAGAVPLVLVACSPEDLIYYTEEPSVLSNIYFADRRALLTLNRSNGGVTLLRDGQLLRKWSSFSTPSREDISFGGDPTEVVFAEIHKGSFFLQAFILYSVALLLLL